MIIDSNREHGTEQVVDVEWQQLYESIHACGGHGVAGVVCVRPRVRAVGEAPIRNHVENSLKNSITLILLSSIISPCDII